MRIPTLVFLTVVAAACQAGPAPNAATSMAAAAEVAIDANDPAFIAQGIDAATAELVQSALAVYEARRRVLLDNIANVDTPGFKRAEAHFAAQRGGDSCAAEAMWSQVVNLRGAVMDGIVRNHSAGAIRSTDRSLDLAIDGDGFFSVSLPDGNIGYTRDGSFEVNADAKLVTHAGNILEPEITLRSDLLQLSIDPQGQVTGRTASNPDTPTAFGQVLLHRFVNPAGLLATSSNVLRQTSAAGSPITSTPGQAGLGTLKQRCLEGSNVDVARELVALQILERNHQSLMQVMRSLGLLAP